jgi:hypothetical protein
MLRTAIAVALVALFVASVAVADDERLPTASDAYTFDSPVLDLKWVNDEKGKPTIVLLQTREGYVHKSVDGGRNWQPLSDLLKPTTIAAPGQSKTSGKESLIQRMSAIDAL